MNEDITIQFRPELRDHIRANMVLYRASAWRTCDRIAGTIGVIAGLTLVLVGEWRWWLAILFPVALAEWSDFLHLSTLQTWIFFKRNPKFKEDYTLTFRPESLHFKTVTIDSTLAWTHYEAVLEDSVLFVLRYGKSLFTAIPKRALKDEDEMDRFRALLQAKIPKYKKQRF
jgi:hypothetical protein